MRLDDGTRVHLADIRMGFPDIPCSSATCSTPTRLVLQRTALGHRGPRATTASLQARIDIAAALDPEGGTDLMQLGLDVTPVAFGPVLLRNDDGRISRFPRAMVQCRTDDGRTGGWIEWNQPDPAPRRHHRLYALLSHTHLAVALPWARRMLHISRPWPTRTAFFSVVAAFPAVWTRGSPVARALVIVAVPAAARSRWRRRPPSGPPWAPAALDRVRGSAARRRHDHHHDDHAATHHHHDHHTPPAPPADKWLFKAIVAEQKFGSVRIDGKITQGTSQIFLELLVNGDGEGGGKFIQNGDLIQLERVGPLLYFDAPKKFWATHATAAQANSYGGKWIEFSALDSRFPSFDQFLDAADLVSPPSRATPSAHRQQADHLRRPQGRHRQGHGHHRGKTTSGLMYIAARGRPSSTRSSTTPGRREHDRLPALRPRRHPHRPAERHQPDLSRAGSPAVLAPSRRRTAATMAAAHLNKSPRIFAAPTPAAAPRRRGGRHGRACTRR